jgi:hypothetical protein
LWIVLPPSLRDGRGLTFLAKEATDG